MSVILNNGVIEFKNKPSILGYAAVGCEDEKQGPLGTQFDMLFSDPLLGLSSWEEAESELQKNAVKIAIEKSGITTNDINFLFAGDLLNQCVASTFGTLGFSVPFIGVYGACSTMALTLINASIFIDNKVGDYAVAVTSSHFCSAEKQFRFPLDYGGQRTPTSQWTATASGAVIISTENSKVKVSKAAIGRVVDLNVTDANNMGAAMAPDDVKIRPYPANEGMVFFYTQIQYLRGFRALFKSFLMQKTVEKSVNEIYAQSRNYYKKEEEF